MRVQFNGRIPAFQAGRVGSIPITRSNRRALSSVDRVPGYEPVGRRFESSRARHRKSTPLTLGCFFYPMARFGRTRTLHLPCKCEGSHTPHGRSKSLLFRRRVWVSAVCIANTAYPAKADNSPRNPIRRKHTRSKVKKIQQKPPRSGFYLFIVGLSLTPRMKSIDTL